MELSNPFQASWFQILKYILIRRPKDLLGLQELVVGQNQQQVLCFWIKMKDDVALNIFFLLLKEQRGVNILYFICKRHEDFDIYKRAALLSEPTFEILQI